MIYLLHYEQPHPNGKRPRHYLGHAEDARYAQRIREHEAGSNKARFTQVMAQLGITFVVARTWEGGYGAERQLKRTKKLARLCPICKATLQSARNITNSANAEKGIDTSTHRAYGAYIPKRIAEREASDSHL